MKKYVFAIALFAIAAFVGAVKFTTYADAGVTPTIPADAKAMKLVEAGSYNFDKAHSFIGFKVKHMGLIEVPGYFRDFTGTVNFDAADPSKSTVQFTAKMTSVDTGVAGRDNHLRTKDFFEVETHPEMTFKSTSVTKKGNGWVLNGDLTMKGVTKPVSIPFDVTGFIPAGERSGAKMGIVGETTINRRDFGVNYGSNMPNGVPVLSDEVKVVLQIEAAKSRPQAPASE
jgi:polyisoprenoid-binding protein YceI